MNIVIVLDDVTRIAVAIFALLVLTVHAVRRDLPALQAGLSAYFTARTRVTMFVAYAALAAALLAHGARIGLAPLDAPLRVVATAGCALAAMLLLPVALTTRREYGGIDTRSSAAVAVHRTATQLAFLSALVAMTVAACVFRSALNTGLALAAWALFALATAGHAGPRYGVWQKGVVAAAAAWLVFSTAP